MFVFPSVNLGCNYCTFIAVYFSYSLRFRFSEEFLTYAQVKKLHLAQGQFCGKKTRKEIMQKKAKRRRRSRRTLSPVRWALLLPIRSASTLLFLSACSNFDSNLLLWILRSSSKLLLMINFVPLHFPFCSDTTHWPRARLRPPVKCCFESSLQIFER